MLSHVDPNALHLQKQGEHNLNTLTFVFAVFDQKENLLMAQQRHATVDVTDAQLPESLKSGMNLDMAFQLKPGSYRIRQVVIDSEHRLSALSRNVDIPEVSSAPAASAAPPPPAQAPAAQAGPVTGRPCRGKPQASKRPRSRLPIRPPTSLCSACGITLPDPWPPSPTSSPRACGLQRNHP